MFNQGLDYFADALKADKDARTVIKWAMPIIVFGWIIIIISALVLLGLLIFILVGVSQGEVALAATIPGAALASAAILLQGAIVLVFGYYVRMRANMVCYQVGSALSED